MLSLHVDNRYEMAQVTDLLITLKKFMISGKLKEKKVAIAAYTNLQAYASTLPGSYQSTPLKSDDSTESEKTNDESTISLPSINSSKARSLMFSEKSTHAYTIFIAGLKDNSSKKDVENILLGIKGVISIFCDLIEQKAVIRATIPSETIISALKQNGKNASLKRRDVISDDSGYLEEDSSDTSSKKSWFGFGSVTKYGSNNDKSKSNQSSWMSRIGKALYII